MTETSNNTPYHNHNNMGDGDKYTFKKRKQKIYLNIIDSPHSGYDGQSFTDPLGMYTGVPENPYEEPVQDADDL